MDIILGFALVLLLVFLWFLNLVGMPGNWLVLIATVTYAYFIPSGWSADIGMAVVTMMLCLALFGEAVELLASAMGVRRLGGTRRGAILSLVGATVGSLAGLFGAIPLIPVPIIGPILGAVVFAAIGASAGAIVGERWAGRTMDQSYKVSIAAFFGRFVGTAGKMVAGAVMIGAALAGITLQML